MTGLDVSHLSADDAVAALRSYPRRFRSSLAVGADEDADELAGRIGADGTCAHEHLLDAASSLMVLGRALHQAVREAEPLLHPAVVDPSRRDWSPPPGLDVAALLAMVEDEAGELADAAAGVSTTDWRRAVRVADGPTITPLDVLREAVRTTAEDLRRVERSMADARRGA